MSIGYKKLGFVLVLAVILTLSPRSYASDYNTVHDYLTLGDFDCRITAKSLLKPGASDGAMAVLGQDPVCFYSISCSPKAGVVNATTAVLQQECPAPKGVCQEIHACARNAALPSRADLESAKWTVFDVEESKSLSESKCRLEQDDKTKMGVFQFLDGKQVAEQFCVASYSCSGEPQIKNLACAPVASSKVKGERACPSLDACIEKRIKMPNGVTEAELKKLAEVNPAKEEALRLELAKPAVVAHESEKPAVNAVSATSFQPRTANIAGSRTSVSNPPASKPPATGHTGRGMK